MLRIWPRHWLGISTLIVLSTCITANSDTSAPVVKAELVTRLAGEISLGPVKDVAEKDNCAIVKSGPTELVLKFASGSGNTAVVRASGDIVIRSTSAVSTLKDIDRLDNDLAKVYDYIASCSGKIPDNVKLACLYYDVKYRLANPGIYKRIVFPQGDCSGELEVPDCRVMKARVIILPAPEKNANVTLREDRIYRHSMFGTKIREDIDVTGKLVHGTHQFRVDSNPYYAPIVVVDAITSATPKGIEFLGGGRALPTAVLPISGAALGPVAETGSTEGGQDTASGGSAGPGGTYVIAVESQKMQELVDQIAAQAAKVENEEKPRKVAILDFELIPERTGTQLDHVVALNVREDLTTAMSAVKCFRVLERSQLAQALENLKLDQTAIVDQETAKKLGKLVSADYVLVGSVSDRGSVVVVQGRMINAETGETSYTGRAEMKKPAAPAAPGPETPAPATRSLEEIEKVIAADPSDASAQAELALYWDSKDDPGRYASAMAKALQLDPDRFAAASAVYNKLAPAIERRGDMLQPHVRLVTVAGGKTVGISDRSSVSARDDSLGIEAVDDTELSLVELYVGDSPFPKATWSLNGRHAALVKLRSPWAAASLIGPRIPVEVVAVDMSNRKSRQKLTLRITR